MQCCGSGIFIPDPDFYPSRIPDLRSRIPDPKTATKERGKFFCHTFYWSHKFHKLFFFMLKRKMWSNFQTIIELFPQKIVTKLSKIWVWDPGSEIGIRDPGSGKKLFRIPDPGVKKATDPGSGSATLLLSLKNYLNVTSKSKRQKFFFKLVFCWHLEGQ
jgi:hypothetical protein